MEPRNRLAEIFEGMGISYFRLTPPQLERLGLTTYRLNQLLANTAATGMTVGEAKNLRAWLRDNFRGTNVYLFEDEMPAHERAVYQQQQAQQALELQ